jgi:hypothetical protein
MSDVITNFKKLEYHVKIKSICHHQMSEIYRKILYYIEYPCVILSFISSSTIILELFQKSEIYDLLVLNIFTFIMVLIANITKILKISQRMEDHKFYSKEFSKIYRNILNFYSYIEEYNNYKINLNVCNVDYELLNKISDFHFNKFLSQIQNQIFYLTEDEPIIWKYIIRNVHNNENDVYFYFIQTRQKQNKYTINQLLYICNLEECNLYEVVKYVLYNQTYQINNNGNYRFIEMQKATKKMMLNYILLEKNISFNNIYKIVISNLEPIEIELQSISIDKDDVNSISSYY